MEEKVFELVTITVPRVMLEHIIREKKEACERLFKDLPKTIEELKKINDGKEIDVRALCELAVAQSVEVGVLKEALEEALAAEKNERSHGN